MHLLFDKLEPFQSLYNDIIRKNLPILISGLGDIGKTAFAISLCEKFNKKILFLTHQKNKADFERRFKDFKKKVSTLPERDNLIINAFAKNKDVDFKRIEELIKIKENGFDILILSPQNLLEKYVDIGFKCLELYTGQEIDLESLIKSLLDFGYDRVKTVEKKGQFAQKGGIVDIYPVLSDYPVRIEFFGDSIDTMKYFEAETQKSFEKIDSIKIYRSSEWQVVDIKKGLETIKKDFTRLHARLKGECKRNLEENFLSFLNGEKIEIERLYPYFFNEFKSVFDLFEDYIIVIDEYSHIYDEIKRYEKDFDNLFFDLLEQGKVLSGMYELNFRFSDIQHHLKNSIIMQTFVQSLKDIKISQIYNFVIKEIPCYNANMDIFIDDVKYYKRNDYAINIFTGTKTSLEYLKSELEKISMDFSVKKNISSDKGIFLIEDSIEKGFELNNIRCVVLSFVYSHQIGQKPQKRKKTKSKRELFYTIEDLKEGSYVVHRLYGIGKFVGFVRMQVEGATKEYLKLEYANNSFLYVPTTNLDSIEKYIGTDNAAPKLSKLGTLDWQKQKQRVKRSLEVIAKDIVQLYAKRQMKKGYKFSVDTVWQKEFEEKFPFVETEGQIKAIEEIKKDMESERPMDRILCGDVGYGKTEVAMRAAFKAVMDSKQVAVLVPTTILAQQHYINFVQRMKEFPISIEVLSRLKSDKEQKNIIKNIRNGTIDIIIGTHRILSNDIKFKDLGLLIIDEEHRFGVEHKEKIKKLKENVDVLTLTATPIPRTLNMALLGIRELSVIEEPPEDRFPVQTYVLEYNEGIIKEAILKEISRGGQVFYLYNRIRDMEDVVIKLKSLLGDDVKIAYAHGQMDEKQLEEVLMDFINNKYDVLVCTTIIESGIDMPNVNTLIVEDADRLGLAQLYQLRGRVGRSNKIAYAYFTFRKNKVLQDEAQKRLFAIKEFTELGSGFKIAMRDLEIRGAGSLVGKLQHGHIDAVGYDMYLKLLSDEIKRLKGEAIEEEFLPQIDINVSAYISNDYIEDDKERINMYKKISSISNKDDMNEIYDELIDRFGDIPKEVDNLIKIAHIKSLCQKHKILSISHKNGSIKMQFEDTKNLMEFINKLVDIKINYNINGNNLILNDKGDILQMILNIFDNIE